MSDDEENIKLRSERIVNFFSATIGKEIKNFPVPPFTKWLNGKITSVKRGEIEFEFLVRPEMANPTGLLHGGMQSAILDETIGVVCSTLGYEGFLISIDLHIDYLGKVKVGNKIKAIARIIREGRHIVHAISEIYDMNDNLVATGNSNLLKTQYKPDYLKFAKEKAED